MGSMRVESQKKAEAARVELASVLPGHVSSVVPYR